MDVLVLPGGDTADADIVHTLALFHEALLHVGTRAAAAVVSALGIAVADAGLLHTAFHLAVAPILPTHALLTLELHHDLRRALIRDLSLPLCVDLFLPVVLLAVPLSLATSDPVVLALTTHPVPSDRK